MVLGVSHFNIGGDHPYGQIKKLAAVALIRHQRLRHASLVACISLVIEQRLRQRYRAGIAAVLLPLGGFSDVAKEIALWVLLRLPVSR
ncbi:hypothetical protein D3C81_1856050 [compost metagenome]